VPLTVAPPPRIGEAAQGPVTAESAATDRAATPPEQPAEPPHPLPAAAARTAAAGVLLALLAAAFAAVVVFTVLVTRMLAVGAVHLEIGGPSLVVLAVGFAFAYAAALLLVTRSWAQLRPTTLLLTLVAGIAWPLSGHPALAAPFAIVLVGLLVDRDRRAPGRLRLTSITGALALATLALFAAVAGAITSPARLAPTSQAATTSADAPEPAAAPATATATPEHERTAPPRKGRADTPTTTVPRRERPARPREARADTPAAATTATPATTVPGDTPAPTSAPLPSATGFVRGYYRDLDAQRFAEAWRHLSPAVQAALGPYARWKAGYAGTISSRPRDFEVSGDAGDLSVTHILVARDKGCDGARQFKVTWQLRAEGSRWIAVALGATVAGSQEC